MAKPQRRFSKSVTARRIKEGRGEGRGAKHKPWLHIQDVLSKNRVTREKGWTTDRPHHLLSDLERDYFLTKDWAPSVIDIREQYPLLPIEETLAIAEDCKIQHPSVRHPRKPRVTVPVVMTTDFVLTIAEGLHVFDQARSIKYSSALESRRTLEKLEIERRYWTRRNIHWDIVTEREISRVFAQNVLLVHKHLTIEDRIALAEPEINVAATLLTAQIHRCTNPLSQVALECDEQLNLQPGTCLTIAYHLMATKQWKIDMYVPIQPGRRLVLLS